MLISIIIPVYNTGKFISKCIESILKQTYMDFELLLIDDGSMDNSSEICNEYAAKDNRIRVFHQKNAGVSAARNKGIDNAKGEYICFIDSDDWIDKQFLESLINEISLKVSDLNILSSILYEYQNNKIERKPSYSKKEYYRQEISELLIENDFFTIGDGGCCSKLFRLALIKLDNQRFYLNNAAYEDTLFTFEYLSKCNSVIVNSGAHYHYVHRDEISLSKTTHPYTNYLDSALVGLKVLFIIKQKYNIPDEHPFFSKGITKFLSILNYSIFSLYASETLPSKANRYNLLVRLFELNKQYKCFYLSVNLKHKVVKTILVIGNIKIADSLFIMLFKISKTRK